MGPLPWQLAAGLLVLGLAGLAFARALAWSLTTGFAALPILRA